MRVFTLGLVLNVVVGFVIEPRQNMQALRKKLYAVSEAKSLYDITLLAGDGIGPEITAATVKAVEAVGSNCGFEVRWDEQLIGGVAIDEKKTPWPKETLESCRKADSILLAAIGGPKWDGNPRELRPETGLLQMRKDLGLFANLRPAKAINQLIDASSLKPEIIQDVDIMVVRELTGDVYFGEPKGIDLDENGQRTGYNNMIYKQYEIERIADVALDVASKRNGKLCSVDKANVLDVSQLWRDIVIARHQQFSQQYTDAPKVELSHMYVDNAAMQLIRWPKQFDTIVTGNIFGDILSDEASMLVGSLGMLPSASLGNPDAPGVFEPIHGSAPDIAGKDLANPLAMILSAAMMLKYDLAQPKAADLLEKAVDSVLQDGKRTKDIASDDSIIIGCEAMGEAVVEAIHSLAASS